jgi:hypothetical protein
VPPASGSLNMCAKRTMVRLSSKALMMSEAVRKFSAGGSTDS